MDKKIAVAIAVALLITLILLDLPSGSTPDLGNQDAEQIESEMQDETVPKEMAEYEELKEAEQAEAEEKEKKDILLNRLGGLMGHYDYINNRYYDSISNDYYARFKEILDGNIEYHTGYTEGYQEKGENASFDSSEKILSEADRISDEIETEWEAELHDPIERNRKEDIELLLGEWRRTDDGSDDVMRLGRNVASNDFFMFDSSGAGKDNESGEWETYYNTDTGEFRLEITYFDEYGDGSVGETLYFDYDRNTDTLTGIDGSEACYARK